MRTRCLKEVYVERSGGSIGNGQLQKWSACEGSALEGRVTASALGGKAGHPVLAGVGFLAEGSKTEREGKSRVRFRVRANRPACQIKLLP